jgi:glycosyltransferase involved in cell wall biosynthesis
MCFLSVIIPTCNSEKTIERCLNSLTSQTYQDFEICIIDGASSDLTIAKVSSFRSCCDRIRIISDKDKGTYDAMNKGVGIARGEWIYFLGSDDKIYDENVFSDIFKNASEKKYGIIYGNVLIDGDTTWAKDGQIYDGEFNINKLLDRNICHQAIFYKKKIFDKLGKYNLRYPVCADWELNLRFFPRTQSKYLNRIIANFSGGGISSKSLIDPIGQNLSVLRKKALLEYNTYQFISIVKSYLTFLKSSLFYH